jgi:hypothetical protein
MRAARYQRPVAPTTAAGICADEGHAGRSIAVAHPLRLDTMKIPTNLLRQMRTCVGVGAILATGCDLATPAPVVAVVPPAPVAAEAPAAPAAIATASPRFAAKVADVVDAARREEAPPTAAAPTGALMPLAGFADDTAAGEDVTAFVPFAGAVATAPVRKRARPSQRPALAVDEPCASDPPAVLAVPTPGPAPGWSTDPCPACGRG